MTDYSQLLGRRPDTPRDPRDWQLRDALPALKRRGLVIAKTDAPTHRTWRRGPLLNQGDTPPAPTGSGDHPYCVGFSTTALRLGAPKRMTRGTAMKVLNDPVVINDVNLITHYALAAYSGAQDRDEWPGRDYDGTSGRGACLWLRDTGQIEEFHAIESADEAADTVLRYRGWLGGFEWSESMFTPDEFGLIHFDPQSIIGGHEVWCRGYDSHKRWFFFQNSWGEAWGRRGCFYMTHADVQTLLDRGGDAFVPSEIAVLR